MKVSERVMCLGQLEADVKKMRAKPDRDREPTVVLMNGCYDLLHPGHVLQLAEGDEQGWYVVVALDTDERVASQKGAGRPCRPWADRATMVAAVRGVWRVTAIGAGVTLVDIMDAIRPNLYVVRPGGSGDEEAKVDRAQALDRRLPVLILPRHGHWSVTEELARLRERDLRAAFLGEKEKADG